MGKKKTGRGKAGADRGKMAKKAKAAKASPKRTTQQIDALLLMSREERISFFEKTPPEKVLDIFEKSYGADMVNILLDLKKATVKRLFEVLAALRKRAIADTATLYYYKEYLTNPLPLRVETDTGRSVPNYYAILGVPRDVSAEDLKAAHRLLSKAHSPDFFSPVLRKTGEERLQEINEAFNNLKNPQKRAKADRILPNVRYLYPRRDQSWLEAVQRIMD